METKRLHLKLISVDDSGFLYELMNTKKWHQFIGDKGITSKEAAQKYIEERMDGDLQKKGFVNHVMTEKETGKAIGTCSLHDREGVNGLDIGYALLSGFEGRGFGTEGAKAMITLAFEEHQQQKVSAITSHTNNGSCHLLEKLGFKENGFIQLPNSPEQIKLYELEKNS